MVFPVFNRFSSILKTSGIADKIDILVFTIKKSTFFA